jgi:Domain of unknown function (DUF4304)
MQAKELLKLLVREQLGPLLRSEGFRGSGQSWRLEHPSGNAALLYFQRSRWNTTDRVEFLINLAVASKLCWDWQLSREPEHEPTARPSALYVNDCPLAPHRSPLVGGQGRGRLVDDYHRDAACAAGRLGHRGTPRPGDSPAAQPSHRCGAVPVAGSA